MIFLYIWREKEKCHDLACEIKFDYIYCIKPSVTWNVYETFGLIFTTSKTHPTSVHL